MAGKDTAMTHLLSVMEPKAKITEAVKVYIKREEEKREKDPQYQPSNVFDLLVKAVEAKSKGQSLKLSLQNLDLDMGAEKQEQVTSLEIARSNALGGAFQYQALQNQSAVAAIDALARHSLSELKTSYSAEVFKSIMAGMLEENKRLSAMCKEKDDMLMAMVKERKTLEYRNMAHERKEHRERLDEATELHLAKIKAQQLEEALEAHIAKMQEREENGEQTTEEQEEEDRGIVEALKEEADSLLDNMGGFIETGANIKEMYATAKSLWAKSAPKTEKAE